MTQQNITNRISVSEVYAIKIKDILVTLYITVSMLYIIHNHYKNICLDLLKKKPVASACAKVNATMQTHY